MRGGRTVRNTRWRWTALASGLLTLALCCHGFFQGFVLEIDEHCRIAEGQDFDPDYWVAHRSDSLLPPYADPCNAGYDLVPGWVNPAIAVTAVLCAVSLAGVLVGAARDRAALRSSRAA